MTGPGPAGRDPEERRRRESNAYVSDMASADTASSEATEDRTGWGEAVRGELGYLAEISGLAGFAIAQPVLSPFGESPETFLALGATSGQIVRFALVVAFVPPLVLWLLAAITRVGGPTARRVAQAVLLGALAGVAAGLVARSLGAGTVLRSIAAVVVGVAVGALRARDVTPLRLFLRYTAPVPAVLAALFLFASPVAQLVRPPEAESSSKLDGASTFPPLVVIVLDELPTASIMDGSGSVEGEAFPNLARVAETSTWYRNHTTGAAATIKSLPVLLTGKDLEDANEETFPTYTVFPDNLFTLLGGTYDIRATESHTTLCPPDLCPAPDSGELDEDVEELTVADVPTSSDPVGSLLDEARALWRAEAWPLSDGYDTSYTLAGGGDAVKNEVVSQALTAVDQIGPATSDRPVFDYLHLSLPHQPWFLLPSGRTHDAPEVPYGNEYVRFWPDGQRGIDTALAGESRMQLQLQWTDRALGTAIDRLEEQGRWDDALVIVTADHGFSFEPATSSRVADRANQRSLAWSPLFVKLPGQTEAEVVDDPVRAVDVVPTILDVLGVDATWDMDGSSLLEGAPPSDRTRRFATATDSDLDPEGGRNGVLDADGLSFVLESGRDIEPGDELGVWRHGRLGDLIGESVDELGVCDETGPAVDVPVSDGWRKLTSGTLPDEDPLPLWHEGTVDDPREFDVAAAVDGRIVGWSTTLPPRIGPTRVGVLFAEPLVVDATSDPVWFEVVAGEECRLRPLAVG